MGSILNLLHSIPVKVVECLNTPHVWIVENRTKLFEVAVSFQTEIILLERTRKKCALSDNKEFRLNELGSFWMMTKIWHAKSLARHSFFGHCLLHYQTYDMPVTLKRLLVYFSCQKLSNLMFCKGISRKGVY